uniref:Uncharacterized protein n=1 Tax=Amblyomma americanum TaxID=6943 RepID=A0A0C9R3S9_AMBAM
MVWYGMVWYGMVWYGMVWYGMVWCGVTTSKKPKTKCLIFGLYILNLYLYDIFWLRKKIIHCIMLSHHCTILMMTSRAEEKTTSEIRMKPMLSFAIGKKK